VLDGSLLNFETAQSHDVTVRVTDGGGLFYDEVFTINLTDVNEQPTDITFTGGTVAENAANGTAVATATGVDPDTGGGNDGANNFENLTYSLTDNAGGRFAINGTTGAITVLDGSLLNFETAQSHDVTVRVTDGGGLFYDEVFTINLTDVNEGDPNDFDEQATNSTADSGSGASETLHGTAGNDTISGNNGNDTIYGGVGIDTINGNNDDDTIYGGSGNDIINGNNGNDTLFGGSGIDNITGGNNNDIVIGGYDGDILNGSGGADIFRYLSLQDAGDTISGFSVADDTFQFDNVGFAQIGADGTLAATAFFVGAGAADASDRIIYNSATGALYYDADGLGGAAQTQIATLSTGLALTFADFEVI
jgi:Ca2+-binding RTX toxin-like protein